MTVKTRSCADEQILPLDGATAGQTHRPFHLGFVCVVLAIVATATVSVDVHATCADQACLEQCVQDCGLTCAGTAGSGKAACIHMCARDNAECDEICVQECSAGPAPAVTCQGGTSACGGVCVDLATDPTNCGACGVASVCGGSCVLDFTHDPMNCGGCGLVCPPSAPKCDTRFGVERPCFPGWWPL
jgi:hypothetical protein